MELLLYLLALLDLVVENFSRNGVAKIIIRQRSGHAGDHGDAKPATTLMTAGSDSRSIQTMRRVRRCQSSLLRPAEVEISDSIEDCCGQLHSRIERHTGSSGSEQRRIEAP